MFTWIRTMPHSLPRPLIISTAVALLILLLGGAWLLFRDAPPEPMSSVAAGRKLPHGAETAVARGQDFRESVLQSGAIRLQPIVLTALTTALGVWPITLAPVFSGLAWALIFGLIASTVFTLVLIPVAYFVLFRPKTSFMTGTTSDVTLTGDEQPAS